MDTMTAAQIWMGFGLIMMGLGGRDINGWIVFFGYLINIALGFMFVVVSGLWPFMVIPGSNIVYVVTTIATAWKQAVQDAKEVE
jgi:hypothetical protein